MYFSGVDSKAIAIDDPNGRCIRLNAELYDRVQNNNEQNTRVFLDTHLLRIRDDDDAEESFSDRIVPKSDASISVGAMPLMPILIYITDILMKAEFREMSSVEFKESYLAPLDDALKETNITDEFLSKKYNYPLGDAIHVEDHIQRYFSRQIEDTTDSLYRELGSKDHFFGKPSIIRPPLDRTRTIKPDIAHILKKGSFRNLQIPEVCFAIGDYKKGTYNLARGFEELKVAIEQFKQYLLDTKRLRSLKSRPLFDDKEWSPRVLFALALRKYLYHAFLCGTDRIFISDHQTFSGFFQYEIVDDEMTIDYYTINDPETVAHGITLRSAIAGFFYKNEADAYDTKGKLVKCFEVAGKTEVAGNTERLDPFENILPRSTRGSSGKQSGSDFSEILDPITENSDSDEFDEIHGNTYCRIIHDAAKFYPNLKLPSAVFVKLYYYSSKLWEENDLTCLHIPDRNSYYGMFFNELLINKKVAKSLFADNFPQLLVSGYWNGLPDHPMHIFESLGKEIPIEEWNMDNVYEVIKLRLQELHLLGISHNDVRLANIHVSVSGKISLIDFGLSDCSNNEEYKKNDFKSLHEIFREHSSNEDNQTNRSIQERECMHFVKAGIDGKYESDITFSSEVFDEGSLESLDTRTTKEDITSNKSHR